MTWEEKAVANIKKWGMQDKETLVLAMTEELGELAQAVLQYNELPPDADPDTQEQRYEHIKAELDDLAPLMYQLKAVLN